MVVRRIVVCAAVVAMTAAALAGCSDSNDADGSDASSTSSAEPTATGSRSATPEESDDGIGAPTDGGNANKPSITPPPTPPPATDLPADLDPVTSTSIVGFWVPTKLPKDAREGAAFVKVESDRTWVGSDGCNGTVGGWTVGKGGSLATNGGASTLMACDGMVAVPAWFTSAVAAGFDGKVLVLVGDDGTTHRLEKGKPARIPTGPDGQTS